MKHLIMLILLCVCIAGCVQDRAGTSTPTPIQTTLSTKMYFFYKNGCPACEKVKPEVEALAKKLNIIFCNVKEMNSECLNVSKDIKFYEEIRAVPTMAIKKDGSFEVYVGADKILELLKSYE